MGLVLFLLHSQGAACAQGTAPESAAGAKPFINVKVQGSFRFAESCTFDAIRNLIVAVSAAFEVAELIAEGIPSPASVCYDSRAS